MNVNELLENYRALLAENHSLREENEILKARLGITDPPLPGPPQDHEKHLPLAFSLHESPAENRSSLIPVQSDPAEKIKLFMSLFKGREDIYAKRWQSREGRAHVWFFFGDPIPASLARKFGSALLTCAMNRRHELNFKSYDRFFPGQDTLPKGGFGNLIALPLQKAAREGASKLHSKGT